MAESTQNRSQQIAELREQLELVELRAAISEANARLYEARVRTGEARKKLE